VAAPMIGCHHRTRSNTGHAGTDIVAVCVAKRHKRLTRARGSVKAKPQGGNTRSHRVEGFKDIGLIGSAQLLWTEHGAPFGVNTVWRFITALHMRGWSVEVAAMHLKPTLLYTRWTAFSIPLPHWGLQPEAHIKNARPVFL
jgi:hypothetical protein